MPRAARRCGERLQFSLDGEPDPWYELEKAGVDARQFEPDRAHSEATARR